jgi:hypothetical protein
MSRASDFIQKRRLTFLKRPSILGGSIGRAPVYAIRRALLHEKSYPRVGFFPLFLCSSEIPTIIPRCFRMRFWPRERIDPRHWMGTISREVGLFCWRSACVTGRAPCASDQLGKIGGKEGRRERMRRCALTRSPVSLPPFSDGNLVVWREDTRV